MMGFFSRSFDVITGDGWIEFVLGGLEHISQRIAGRIGDDYEAKRL